MQRTHVIGMALACSCALGDAALDKYFLTHAHLTLKAVCNTCRYKAYLKHIAQRVNTVNGLQYSNDSTIMAWELLNEPRCQLSDGCAPGTLAVGTRI